MLSLDRSVAALSGEATVVLLAVGLVFSLLLFFEIAGLVFSLARSVADSAGKQFELLALILIREAFLEFAHSGEPMDWNGVEASVDLLRLVLARENEVIIPDWQMPIRDFAASAYGAGFLAVGGSSPFRRK